MASVRHLPQKFNPLMIEEVPPHEVLVARRQLGHTNLTIKIESGGGSNSVKTKFLGTLEYAHLRVPLPKGIVSGIFNPSPLSYYLMRRSSDGYVSASGMFKATFPYATLVEEDIERKYIKALPATSSEEIAGNLWISPQYALELAEEYHITSWIKALLDNTPIETDLGKDLTTKKIKPPPPFEIDKAQPPVCQPRDRLRRFVSPSKNSLPRKVIGTCSLASKAEINAKSRADTEDLSGKLNGPIPETLEFPIQTSTKIQEKILLSIKINDPIIENAPRTITHHQIDSTHADHTCTYKEPVVIAHASKNSPPGVLNIQDKISPDIDGHTTSVPENSPGIESESMETTNALKKSTSEISSDDENEPSGIVNDPEIITTEDPPHIKSDLIHVANEIFLDSETEVKLEVLPEIDVKTEVESIYSQSSSEVSKNESSSQDTENLISIAKKMVEDAVTDEKFELIPRKLKRKALELELVDMDEENIDEDTTAKVKRVKIEEKELKKEKIKNRALLGITATLAIGAVIQYAFNAV